MWCCLVNDCGSPVPRLRVWEDGTLEILNVSQDDEGSYTCFAENDQGKDNSTGSLTVKGQLSVKAIGRLMLCWGNGRLLLKLG